MAKIAYARVSSNGQSLDVQLEKLKGCDKIFREKISGRTDNRPQLQLCLDYVRDGDTLVITKLDRLGRSTRDLLNIINQLEEKAVMLQVIDQKEIDTSTSVGRFFLSVLGAVASFENDLRKDRQVSGIEMAKSKGVQFGRKPSCTPAQIEQMKVMRDSGAMIKDIMTTFSLSKASVYRLLPSE